MTVKIVVGILCFVFGCTFGAFMATLMVASSRAERREEVEIVSFDEYFRRKSSGWISVDEKTPERYRQVLVAIRCHNSEGEPAKIVSQGAYGQGKWRVFYGPILDGERVTHWMPIPEPPND